MKIFISWSGDQGKCIAEGLDKLIRRVIQSVKPWVSSKGIAPGEWWRTKLFEALNECEAGIVCLTPHALEAPWLHYEAGALVQKFKEPNSVKIWTYLFGVGREQVKGPLAEVQHSFATRDDTRRMLLSIKKFAEPDLEDDVFEDSFNGVWNQMERVFEEVKQLAPITEPAQPNPDAERDLILKEILRSQVDVRSKVDAVLAAQATDARKIIRSISAREEDRVVLTQKDRDALEKMLLDVVYKEHQRRVVAEKRSRESLPRELVEAREDEPPEDDIPFHEAPPDDDVPF